VVLSSYLLASQCEVAHYTLIIIHTYIHHHASVRSYTIILRQYAYYAFYLYSMSFHNDVDDADDCSFWQAMSSSSVVATNIWMLYSRYD
jgi:hypothetical protein